MLLATDIIRIMELVDRVKLQYKSKFQHKWEFLGLG